MHKLRCSYQNYAWGKIASESEVASIVVSGSHQTGRIDSTKPFAEFWMGVHPNGPSVIKESGEALSDFIKHNEEVVAQHENESLQFLFKVLSVNSALSVQTHPSKEQASILHAADPKNYPDANHKPEMAIALTNFQLLCGFRPSHEISSNIRGCPELLSLLGDISSCVVDLENESSEKREQSLRTIFTHIWNSKQEDLTSAISEMIARLKASGDNSALVPLLITLDEEFPGGDVGVFAPLFLNYFTLSPGEATFLGPNRPHAYLKGDCIECMACSDNTIRAGLTPKFKDIETLCTNMDYSMLPPPIFEFTQLCDGIRSYAPSVPDFAVHRIESSASLLSPVGASSLLIVIQGSTQLIHSSSSLSVERGDVIFLAANILADIHFKDPSSDFEAYRAFTPKSP